MFLDRVVEVSSVRVLERDLGQVRLGSENHLLHSYTAIRTLPIEFVSRGSTRKDI